MVRLNVMIFRLNQLLQNIVAPQRELIGISKGQPKVLRYVLAHDGCTQNDIAMAYEVKPATVSKIIDGLAKNAMIVRKEGKDRRSVSLSVTKLGKETIEKWDKVMDETMHIMTKGFSDEEIKGFYDLLKRASDNLKGVNHEDLI